MRFLKVTDDDAQAALDNYTGDSIVVITGIDYDGDTVTIGCDHRPGLSALGFAIAEGEILISFEDWQVLGSVAKACGLGNL